MKTKTFDLATVLSVTTGILLTDIGNVFSILNYMTGDNLFIHQLSRVSKECKPIILDQYPDIANIDSAGVNRENWQEFIDGQIKKFGNEFEIIPIGLFEHNHIDPIKEILENILYIEAEATKGEPDILPSIVHELGDVIDKLRTITKHYEQKGE